MRSVVLIAIFLAFAAYAYSYVDCSCGVQTTTYCDGDFLVTNTYTGTCTSGTCDYTTSETACQYGCYDSQCTDQPSLPLVEPSGPSYSGPPHDLYAWPLGSNWYDPVKRNYTIPVADITEIISSTTSDEIINISIVTIDDELVYYNVMAHRNVIIFFFFHIDMKSYYYIEPENLTIVKTFKPFWSFLAQ